MTIIWIELVKAMKENLMIQVKTELAIKIRRIAEEESTSVDELVDQALRDFLKKKSLKVPRQHVMEAFDSSVASYDSLYERLS